MRSFPFPYSFLVLLSLQVVALFAQRLEVGAVVEPVGAYGPRHYVVHACGRSRDPLPGALGAQGMLGAEGPREPRPPRRVVRVGGALAEVSVTLLRPGRMVPWQLHVSIPCSPSSGIRSSWSFP